MTQARSRIVRTVAVAAFLALGGPSRADGPAKEVAPKPHHVTKKPKVTLPKGLSIQTVLKSTGEFTLEQKGARGVMARRAGGGGTGGAGLSAECTCWQGTGACMLTLLPGGVATCEASDRGTP